MQHVLSIHKYVIYNDILLNEDVLMPSCYAAFANAFTKKPEYNIYFTSKLRYDHGKLFFCNNVCEG